MADKFISLTNGLAAIKNWVKDLLSYKADKTELPKQATDTTLGTVKLNAAESVGVNSDGQLTVGGRLGQYPNGGVFYPTTIEPSNVGTSSFLMTDGAKGVQVVSRTFAIMAGAGITCKSAAAGSTQYRVVNNYANRFTCFAIKGGRLALNQTDATENGTAYIQSIKFANGNDISVHFGPPESNNDIIITVDRTVNPNAATTTLRGYGTNGNSDNILVGQGVGGSNSKGISLGQSTYVGGHQTLALGNSVHVMANNSVGLGNTILVNKQFCLGTGQGHDFTAATNGTTAVGTWSVLSSNTKFAVGVGTSYTARKNIFEVTNDSGATGLVMVSPSGTKYKLTVDDNGNLTTSAVQ